MIFLIDPTVSQPLKLKTQVINKNPFDPSFHELLLDIAKQHTSSPEDFVAEHFYTESYQLTTQAVKAMLKHLGILS